MAGELSDLAVGEDHDGLFSGETERVVQDKVGITGT